MKREYFKCLVVTLTLSAGASLAGCASTAIDGQTTDHSLFDFLHLSVTEGADGDGLIKPLLKNSRVEAAHSVFVTRNEERAAQDAMTTLKQGEVFTWHNEQLGDMRIRPLNGPYPKGDRICREYTIEFYGDTTTIQRVGWRDAGARRGCRIKDSPSSVWDSTSN